MFGEVEVTPVLNVRHCATIEVAVGELLEFTERPAIARWLQMPRSLILFLIQPDDPESGAIYVYDQRNGAWIWVDFKDTNYGGYSVAEFDRLLNECRFLDVVAVPDRLTSHDRWFVRPGRSPEVLRVNEAKVLC